jgi:hypothetical protein
VLFDLLFLIQHYVLYRQRIEPEVVEDDISSTQATPSLHGKNLYGYGALADALSDPHVQA